MDDFHLEVELLLKADERDHDFGLHFDAGLLHIGDSAATAKTNGRLTPAGLSLNLLS